MSGVGRKGRAAFGGDGLAGRVVATAGRRVVVRDEPPGDAPAERVCFLSGQRAVVGDRVTWVEVRGEGGRVTAVAPRETALVRLLGPGEEQVLAANLTGLLVVVAPRDPPFRAGLVDRYAVAARASGLAPVVVLNKVDLGVPAEVEEALALRSGGDDPLPVVRVSAREGAGLDALRERLRGGTWALVGHSGTGKTSLAAALLPGQDVGEIGHVSEYWGTGRHTTTGSRLFAVPGGGELVDSPGIRSFAPGRLAAEDARRHFPGVAGLPCRYRDCVHREGEEGCVAPERVPAELLASYRRLHEELASADRAAAKGHRLREAGPRRRDPRGGG